MPPAPTGPVLLVCGEDDLTVKQRARQVFHDWSEELGGMDHETIDAQVSNGGDADRAVARLREALNTLPFFGGGKAVWFQNCTFLADDRVGSSAAVKEALEGLTAQLKNFNWTGVRLIISAPKVDKRKAFYKTLEKLGTVEHYAALSMDDKDWADKAEQHALRQLRDLKKRIDAEALGALVANIGPNLRQISSEAEKLALYVGDRAQISLEDVEAIVTRNKHARAFALSEALGNRDLPALLRCLDEELWEMHFNKEKSEIGLLYGVIFKVRTLIYLEELAREELISVSRDFITFRRQLEAIPPDKVPGDRRINPLQGNPYVLFKALPQVGRYTRAELVRAMELLLECNQKLVSSSSDEKRTLQQTLVDVVRGLTPPAPRGRRAA